MLKSLPIVIVAMTLYIASNVAVSSAEAECFADLVRGISNLCFGGKG